MFYIAFIKDLIENLLIKKLEIIKMLVRNLQLVKLKPNKNIKKK